MDVEAISHGGQRQNLYNIDNSLVVNNKNVQNNTENSTVQNRDTQNDGISEKDAKKAVKVMNDLLKDKSTHIEYEQDKNFKQVMIMKVVDNDTRKVINQIPSKDILDMVAQFCEMAGLIVNKKA